MQAQHYFHCTDRYRGQRWVAERITPPVVKYHFLKEPTTPRLCVCPTVAGCFAAKLFLGEVFIYRTISPRRSLPPNGVWDSVITGERWIIPPVELIFWDKIPASVVEEISIGQHVDLLAKGHCIPLIRLRGYRQAIRVLEALDPSFTSPSEKHFVKRAWTALLNDPCFERVKNL